MSTVGGTATATGYHMLKVEGYSRLEKMQGSGIALLSCEFEAAGHTWNMGHRPCRQQHRPRRVRIISGTSPWHHGPFAATSLSVKKPWRHWGFLRTTAWPSTAKSASSRSSLLKDEVMHPQDMERLGMTYKDDDTCKHRPISTAETANELKQALVRFWQSICR